jgi:hypothetical protein
MKGRGKLFKFLRRRQPKATSKANAIALSNLVTEAAAKNLRLSAELGRARFELNRSNQALNQIIGSVDSVNTPNGTLRKVRRIAAQGLGEQQVGA